MSALINAILRNLIKLVLSLRYDIRLRGWQPVAQRGQRGILFLANHPALIDPIVVMAYLHGLFAPRALADQEQVDRPIVRWLARQARIREIPDVRTHGPQALTQVQAMLRDCTDGLRRGENLLIYPSGHIYRTRFENLRGNSSVESMVRAVPDARIVLVRTRGLWGSSFGLAGGAYPSLGRVLPRLVLYVLANFLLFTPRRRVTVELFEPADFPRTGDRHEMNRFCEQFYNQDAPPNTYVPYTLWEGGRTRALPDPEFDRGAAGALEVSATTRQLVENYLRELCGTEVTSDSQRLAEDLGLDSLSKAELLLWLNREFGAQEADVDALHTVGDVLLAARGQAVVARAVEIRPPSAEWFKQRNPARVTVPPGDTLTSVFLRQARRDPGRAVLADQIRGVVTYRDIITAILVLKPLIARLPGRRVGLMLPASVGAAVSYFASLFAGKQPVMVNWTTGTRNVLHALSLTEVQHVLTARAVVSRIESQGTDLGPLKDRFLYLEDMAASVGRGTKLWAAIRARFSWAELDRAGETPVVQPSDAAVVLLTSGSESLPKAVPLTHANLLANVRDVLSAVNVYERDRLIGLLPPFHSFGLTVTTIMPMIGGVPVVFHANPTQAWVLARLIEAYRVTVLCGTPTFLSGILRASRGNELRTLRLIVTGAEKCPDRTYDALAARCPSACLLEGYGVSECSPIVSVNRESTARRGTIGQPLPAVECAIVDVEGGGRVVPGATGELLVRGPSVFPGYLGNEVASPFVEFEGKQWYRTGDLVSADEDGALTFRGRIKRFVKLGGEMISLPAIEAVLERQYASEADEGPVLAVEATPDEHNPEVVLFTTKHLLRSEVNRLIRAAGLSALHNVGRVVHLEQIPLLGTGKTDYRALRGALAGDPHEPV